VDDNILNNEKAKLFNKLSTCQEVQQTISSNGWRTIIEPIIDKMIIDTVGGKVKGRWTGGALADGSLDKSFDFYLGYKQFGIDLTSRIYNYVDSVKKLSNQIDNIDKQLNAPLVTPMFEHDMEYIDSEVMMQPRYNKRGGEEGMPCKKSSKRASKKKMTKRAAKAKKRR